MNIKNKKLLGLGLCALSIIILIIIMVVRISKNNIRDNEKFANEYTDVAKNNVFIYKDIKEIIKILENGTGVVYFGFPESTWAQIYTPILNDAAKENGIERIYYYNIKNIRSKNTSEYQKLVKILKNYLSKDDEGNKRIYVPDVYIVKDGKILSHNNETSIMINDIEPKEYWTDSKKQELKTTLKAMMNEVKNVKCKICQCH